MWSSIAKVWSAIRRSSKGQSQGSFDQFVERYGESGNPFGINRGGGSVMSSPNPVDGGAFIRPRNERRARPFVS